VFKFIKHKFLYYNWARMKEKDIGQCLTYQEQIYVLTEAKPQSFCSVTSPSASIRGEI